MLRLTLCIFCASGISFVGSSYAQIPTAATEPLVDVAIAEENTQVSKPDVIQNKVISNEFISASSAAKTSFEPATFLDAYELGFIEDNAGVKKQDFTQDELAKIKQSFDVPKSKDDPRYKPVFNIRAGEEKPEWRSGDYYPAGR